MNESYSHQTLIALREKMRKGLTVNNLKDLCGNLQIDYEDLESDGKAGKIRDLISFCQRHGRIHELMHWIETINPLVVEGIYQPTPTVNEVVLTLSRIIVNLSPSVDKMSLQEYLQELEAELAKGKAVNDGELANLVNQILDSVQEARPNVVQEMAKLFNAPPLIELAGNQTKGALKS